MAGQVQFRRIGGRVVPIRSRQAQQDRNAGKAMVGVGVGVALASGLAAGKIHTRAQRYVRSAAGFRKAARTAYKAGAANALLKPRLNRSGPQFLHLAAKRMGSAQALMTTGTNVRRAGLAAGTALITGGVHKLLPERIKKDPVLDATATASIGVGSAFLIQTGYYKQLGRMKAVQAAKFAAKKVIKRGFR